MSTPKPVMVIHPDSATKAIKDVLRRAGYAVVVSANPEHFKAILALVHEERGERPMPWEYDDGCPTCGGPVESRLVYVDRPDRPADEVWGRKEYRASSTPTTEDA